MLYPFARLAQTAYIIMYVCIHIPAKVLGIMGMKKHLASGGNLRSRGGNYSSGSLKWRLVRTHSDTVDRA